VKLRPRYPMMFLVALAVAFWLWYAVAGQRRERISERQVVVPLTLANVPRTLVITNDVPESVSLRLRGALGRALADARNLEVVLDLSDAQPGTRTYPVKESQINLPPDVSVVSIDPPEITLHLEHMETKSVPVRAVIEGTPAAGFEVGEIRIVPPNLTVQGPESLLEALEIVETTPVRVDGATGPVETAAQPRLPHPLLRPLTGVPLLVVANIIPAPTPTPTPPKRRGTSRRSR
jgi:YbbR domain-containing protein